MGVALQTHFSRSYINVYIRFHHMNNSILNVHILAIPLFEWYTGAVIIKVCYKALDFLCPAWKEIIIGICTDGDKKITGRH